MTLSYTRTAFTLLACLLLLALVAAFVPAHADDPAPTPTPVVTPTPGGDAGTNGPAWGGGNGD